MTIKKHIDKYEKACNEIVKDFSEKQDLDFSYWIDRVGSIACFIDQYYFDLHDLIHDLETEQPKGFILEWHDANVNNGKVEEHINYSSYIMGLRHENFKN
jgi:hypothetical protein